MTSSPNSFKLALHCFHNVSSQEQGPHGLCINSSVQVSTQRTAFGRQFIPSTLVQWCLIEGDSEGPGAVFTVTVTDKSDISDLKELVHEKGIERHILAKDLVLLKAAALYSPVLSVWLNFLCFFRSISISVVIIGTPLAVSGSKMMT